MVELRQRRQGRDTRKATEPGPRRANDAAGNAESSRDEEKTNLTPMLCLCVAFRIANALSVRLPATDDAVSYPSAVERRRRVRSCGIV